MFIAMLSYRAAVHSVCYTDLTDCLSAREGRLGDLVLLRAKQNNVSEGWVRGGWDVDEVWVRGGGELVVG